MILRKYRLLEAKTIPGLDAYSEGFKVLGLR